jgi:hypothetical protein
MASAQICNQTGPWSEFGRTLLEGMRLRMVLKHAQSVHGAVGFQTTGREQVCNLVDDWKSHLQPGLGKGTLDPRQ